VSASSRYLDFGDFRIDESRRLLLREGEVVPLTSKVFDTLMILVENRGRLIEKDELMSLLWPSSHVEEGNLTVNVSHLRKALDDTRNERRFIVTIPGHGYKFVGDVREAGNGGNGSAAEASSTERDPTVVGVRAIDADPPQATQLPRHDLPPPPGPARGFRPAAVVVLALAALVLAATFLLRAHSTGETDRATAAHTRSIAILPFEPLADRERDAYLGLGMADALITKLSGIRHLTVRPTSAILRYDASRHSSLEIGREQRVDAVLEGTIERADERVRMTVRLLNVKDGAALWSYQSEESQSRDLFALQDLLSEKIADALLVNLTGAERRGLRKHYTENPEAYDAYVKGRYYWNQRTSEGLLKAIGLFEKAVHLDPRYALAYSGLADSYDLSVWYVPLPASEAVPKLEAAARRAVELDPLLSEAHLSLSTVYSFRWEWDKDMAEHERAIALNPGNATAHHWYSLALGLRGKFDEAIVEAQKARELDPLSPSINTDLGWVYYLARRYDRAIEAYRSTLEMDPDFSLTHFDLSLAYSAVGKNVDAVAEMRKASERGSDYWAGLGYVCGVAGKRDEALLALRELTALSKTRYVPPYHFAWIYTGLGDRDRAITELDQVYREHTQHVVDFKTVPMFDGLRSDPRFQDLVRRVAL
jgi:DNA-binding winged helix-turn-helix (wHTH) protein/TolB-like protein/Tfp pilus assembly protein PilF